MNLMGKCLKTYEVINLQSHHIVVRKTTLICTATYSANNGHQNQCNLVGD